MAMINQERAVIFFDARNLIKGQETFREKGYFSNFGYREIMDYFSRQFHIIRGYYYDGAPHSSQLSEDRKKFFRLLRQWGITLRLKEIDFNKHNHSQKGVDIYLTSDMISLAYENAYDIAIICSGDGDYEALIELVKSKGKKVWVLSYECCTSQKLRECSDNVLFVGKIDSLHRYKAKNSKDLNK